MIRLYFYGPPTPNAAYRASYEAIKDFCVRAGILLSSNTEAEEVNLPEETITESVRNATPLLDAMQAVIVEGTTPDPQSGYLLAYALAEKKPLLYLYERGRVAPDVLRYLNLKDVPKHITIATYRPETLEQVLAVFLGKLGDVSIREVPRIKFTLRMTKTIDEYLDYQTRNTKLSKADYIREKLDQLIEQDEKFKQFLRKHKS